MIGVDVLPDFWELGLEIFRDRHKMQGRFTWRSLWEEVAEMTGTGSAVEIQSWRIIEEGEQSAWMGETATPLKFLCTRQE